MGKEEDFIELIREHEGIIFKITTIFTNNEQGQKDLYQDIVFQLWKSFESFRSEASISTWMYKVAMNTAIVQNKKQRKTANTVPIEQVVLKQSEQEDPEYENRIRKLYSLIDGLNDLEKGLMLLLLEGKKYQEISDITGLSKTNVGTRINRIKNKFREEASTR